MNKSAILRKITECQTALATKKLTECQLKLAELIILINTNESQKQLTTKEIISYIISFTNINVENATSLCIQRVFNDYDKEKVFVDFKGGKYYIWSIDSNNKIIDTKEFKLKKLITSNQEVGNYLKSLNIGDIENRETMMPKITKILLNETESSNNIK